MLDEAGQASNPAHALESSAEEALLDAYSRVVTRVAESVAPAVARLDITRRVRGRDAGGSVPIALLRRGRRLTLDIRPEESR